MSPWKNIYRLLGAIVLALYLMPVTSLSYANKTSDIQALANKLRSEDIEVRTIAARKLNELVPKAAQVSDAIVKENGQRFCVK